MLIGLFVRWLNLKILYLAIPLILSNITIPLLGVVNTFMVGHLGNASYLAAVGLGEALFDILYWAFNFLRFGTITSTAQACGRGDANQLGQILWQSVWTAVGLGLLIWLVRGWVLVGVLQLVPQADDAVVRLATLYYDTRIIAAPAVLLNFVVLGALIGFKDTLAPLINMLSINVTAILLGLLLVFGYGMNVDGVAWADVIGQYVGLVVGVILLCRVGRGKVRLPSFRLQYDLLKQQFFSNRDIFIRTACLMFCFTFFTLQSARYGVLVLAANTLLMNFAALLGYAQDGFANVAQTLVGESVGQNDAGKMHRYIRETLVWNILVSLLFFAFFFAFGGQLVAMLTDVASVIHVADENLAYAIWLPVVSCLCFFFDGVYLGAGEFAVMRNAMILSALAFLLTWYVSLPWGVDGLWLAILGFFLYRSITLSGHFLYKCRIGRFGGLVF